MCGVSARARESIAAAVAFSTAAATASAGHKQSAAVPSFSFSFLNRGYCCCYCCYCEAPKWVERPQTGVLGTRDEDGGARHGVPPGSPERGSPGAQPPGVPRSHTGPQSTQESGLLDGWRLIPRGLRATHVHATYAAHPARRRKGKHKHLLKSLSHSAFKHSQLLVYSGTLLFYNY